MERDRSRQTIEEQEAREEEALACLLSWRIHSQIHSARLLPPLIFVLRFQRRMKKRQKWYTVCLRTDTLLKEDPQVQVACVACLHHGAGPRFVQRPGWSCSG